jgi:Helix-turn-helix domain of transposase family ISL3
MNSLFFEQLLGYLDLGVVNFRVDSTTIYLDCISNLCVGINTQTMEKSDKVVDTRQRTVREMSILGKSVILNIQVRKFKTSSNQYFWEELSMVPKGSHFTKRYEEFIFESCKGSDMSRIAEQETLLLDSVLGIYHLHAKKNSQP